MFRSNIEDRLHLRKRKEQIFLNILNRNIRRTFDHQEHMVSLRLFYQFHRAEAEQIALKLLQCSFAENYIHVYSRFYSLL